MEQRGVISDDKGLELAWELSDDGELTITGEGRIPDCYTRRRPGAPWDSVSSGIKSVTVGEGITAIGCRAFRGYPALTRITLPGTLTTIASEAFFYCPIEEVILPPAAWLVHRDGADPAEYLEAFRKWNRNNMHQNAPEQEGQERPTRERHGRENRQPEPQDRPMKEAAPQEAQAKPAQEPKAQEAKPAQEAKLQEVRPAQEAKPQENREKSAPVSGEGGAE